MPSMGERERRETSSVLRFAQSTFPRGEGFWACGDLIRLPCGLPPSPRRKAFGRAAISSDTPAGSLIREHTEASYVFREVRPVHLQTGRPAMTYNDVLRTMSLRGNRAGSAIPVAIRFLTTDQSPWQSALLIMDQSPRNPFSIYSTTSPWVSAPSFSILNSQFN